ncbi:19887_t:CDS:2 [Gigaspora margarita]|uniref:19887_t:CDS:1 n=1 Tax=Gigaspora margarita TaxID=4874 RepID=A0ABN7UNT5_GIGMA|nr:19887_t:CDS:2 [Gigaspora margarita]
MCDQQKAYNTIASYRSAINEIHNHVDGYPAAFLIALGSASRPSDLHRIVLNTLQKSKTGISFTIINPKETNISISHTAVDTISRWIKEILSQTDPDAKAKDIRSLLALLAQDAATMCIKDSIKGVSKILEWNKVSSQILNQARSQQ